MEIYEYQFGIHNKGIVNKALANLLSPIGIIELDFTEDEFNEFRVQLALLDIELCEISRRIKTDLETVF